MFFYLIIGALLAQRCKVFVVIPAIGVATTLAVVAGVRAGATSWQIIFSAVFDVAALQLGYFAGSGMQLLANSFQSISTRGNAAGPSMWPRHTQN